MVTNQFLKLAKEQFMSTIISMQHNDHSSALSYLKGGVAALDATILVADKIKPMEDLELKYKVKKIWDEFNSETIDESQFMSAIVKILNED